MSRHRAFERRDRFVAPDEQRHDPVREDDDVAKRQNGEEASHAIIWAWPRARATKAGTIVATSAAVAAAASGEAPMADDRDMISNGLSDRADQRNDRRHRARHPGRRARARRGATRGADRRGGREGGPQAWRVRLNGTRCRSTANNRPDKRPLPCGPKATAGAFPAPSVSGFCNRSVCERYRRAA